MSRLRVVIENITPQIDGGRFAAKGIVGQTVVVEADVFTDGHDKVKCSLLHRSESEKGWHESPMQPLGNDRWQSSFVPKELGPHLYTVKAWLEPVLAWQREANTKPDPQLTLLHDPPLTLFADRERAAFSSWYEFFPRSTATRPGKHGTFADCEARLPYVAEMGFDVLYLPPIHPIGDAFRKGANNSLTPKAGEPGSPWAIGAEAGGHKSIHPELGTLEDFRRLVAKAARARNRDRARHRLSGEPGSPVRARAPGVVSASAGRHHSVRRESAEEIPGHLPVPLRRRSVARAVGGAEERGRLLDRTRRAHLPCGQSAHQAVRDVGMADRRSAARASGRTVPRRGVHAARR